MKLHKDISESWSRLMPDKWNKSLKGEMSFLQGKHHTQAMVDRGAYECKRIREVIDIWFTSPVLHYELTLSGGNIAYS